jgi:HipA-like C-terminal domain
MASVEQLLAVLGRQVEVRASELVSRLGVSQQTVSRLITAAGERVCRMGRARATRYALTRALPVLGTRVPVHQVDERGDIRQYGVLHLLASGSHWLERADGVGKRFEGLPPFAADMSPQGYIGRSFTTRHPELSLPPSITYWSDDHRLIALARRGEDCVGDLILGDESLNRFLAETPRPAHRGDYPELLRTSLSGQPGSSAGGEQPKFAAYSEGRHVLVKFADRDEGAASRRWRDLLVCESFALEAIRQAGHQAASASPLLIDGYRFLEVERFDRMGVRGRKALVSLRAIDNEYFGDPDSWTKAAWRLLKAGFIDAEDARRMRWLDTFGQLIGNTDRHFGNLSFFVEEPGFLLKDPGLFAKGARPLRLAPVYDMLPMVFAPEGASVVERPFVPRPPTVDTLDVWPHAARSAVAYWSRLVDSDELSGEFRERCARCRDAVEELTARTPGGL